MTLRANLWITKKGKVNRMEHKETIQYLIDSISESRIYAGALFEECCNDGDYDKAVIFQLMRDTLEQYKISLNSLIEVNKNK